MDSVDFSMVFESKNVSNYCHRKKERLGLCNLIDMLNSPAHHIPLKTKACRNRRYISILPALPKTSIKLAKKYFLSF